jgi:hypothetical protein
MLTPAKQLVWAFNNRVSALAQHCMLCPSDLRPFSVANMF